MDGGDDDELVLNFDDIGYGNFAASSLLPILRNFLLLLMFGRGIQCASLFGTNHQLRNPSLGALWDVSPSRSIVIISTYLVWSSSTATVVALTMVGSTITRSGLKLVPCSINSFAMLLFGRVLDQIGSMRGRGV